MKFPSDPEAEKLKTFLAEAMAVREAVIEQRKAAFAKGRERFVADAQSVRETVLARNTQLSAKTKVRRVRIPGLVALGIPILAAGVWAWWRCVSDRGLWAVKSKWVAASLAFLGSIIPHSSGPPPPVGAPSDATAALELLMSEARPGWALAFTVTTFNKAGCLLVERSFVEDSMRSPQVAYEQGSREPLLAQRMIFGEDGKQIRLSYRWRPCAFEGPLVVGRVSGAPAPPGVVWSYSALGQSQAAAGVGNDYRQSSYAASYEPAAAPRVVAGQGPARRFSPASASVMSLPAGAWSEPYNFCVVGASGSEGIRSAVLREQGRAGSRPPSPATLPESRVAKGYALYKASDPRRARARPSGQAIQEAPPDRRTGQLRP